MADKLEIIQHESLAEALLHAQSEYPPLEKGSTVDMEKYKYKYADLAYTKKMTDPYLWKHGLVVSGRTEYRDGKEFQVDVLRHIHSKEEDGSEVEITESDMKQFGGNSTYAKRYNYCNLTGRVGEDDSESRPLDNRRQASGPKEDPEAVAIANIQRGEEELCAALLCTEFDLRSEFFKTDVPIESASAEERDGYLEHLRGARDVKRGSVIGAITKTEAGLLNEKIVNELTGVDAMRREAGLSDGTLDHDLLKLIDYQARAEAYYDAQMKSKG